MHPVHGAVAGHHVRPGGVLRTIARCLCWPPMFAYLLLLYVLVEINVGDVRAPLFEIATFTISWVEVMYAATSMVVLFEILRVSEPGVDNTWEAVRMGVVFAVQLVIFVLAIAGVVGIKDLFSTSEFFMLLMISMTQTVVAFLVNARTLKRTFEANYNSQ